MDSATLWNAAAGFFLIAIPLFAAKFEYSNWSRSGDPPNILAWYAAIFGLCGLPLSRIARGEAKNQRAGELPFYLSAEGWCTFAVFTAFLALYAVTAFHPGYDEQVRQAVAFLHGHTYIQVGTDAIEHAQIGPYSYALHPPMGPVLLMPFVAIWGYATNQALVSVLIGAVSMALAWRLLYRFDLSTNGRVWLTIFFGAGTTFWFETILGNTWSFPEVVAVLFTLAALNELFGQARPFWVGTFSALSCFARYDQALAAPVFLFLLWWRGRTIRELFWIIPPFIAVGIAFVGINEARFNSFFDQGVMLTGPKDAPAFGLRYLANNLYTVFFLPPKLANGFPYIRPSYAGQCLALTSPAFVLVFRANMRRMIPIMMLLAAAGASMPSLLCYANGFAQFGARHYVQVFPYLLVMMAIGMRRGIDQMSKILIVVSILLVSYGAWHYAMWNWT